MIAIVEVLERIRKKTVSFSPPLSCIIFLHRFSRFKDETEVDVNTQEDLREKWVRVWQDILKVIKIINIMNINILNKLLYQMTD